MEVKQVYSILNSVVKEMNGLQDLTLTNLQGIISLGDHVINSGDDASKDDFLNTLVDRIGKTIVSNRAYSAPDMSLVYNNFTFGAVLQKIYVEPMEATESAEWGLNNGQSLASFIIAKPTAHQNLFSNLDTWQINVTIPDVQLRTAFTGEEAMAAFISAIWTAMESAISQQLEALTNLAYASMIGESVVYKSANATSPTVIDLLGAYNAKHSDAPITRDEALESLDFLKFAALQINLWSNRMTRMSTQFNDMGYKRHTPREYQRLTVLDQFAMAMAYYLQSDTYHKELVTLPNYTTTPYWQGIGNKGYAFDDVSSINVRTPKTNKTVAQQNVVACLTDIEALGVMIDDRRTKAQYLPNEEVTTYFEKFNRGMMYDPSENHIIFTLGTIATPAQ